MKLLIFGSGGQLGREVVKYFPDAVTFDHSEGSTRFLDITKREMVREAILENLPEMVINCAAMTSVDNCETHRKEAYEANSEAVKEMVAAARDVGAYLINISTDYVFDGAKGDYREEDIPGPVNFYGLSKLIGDAYVASYQNSLTIRTSGVFGRGSNFPLFVLNRLRRMENVDALSGSYSPIHANLLARAIKSAVYGKMTGVINIAGDKVSRSQFAMVIANRFKLDAKLVKEVKSLPSFVAARPFDSSLNIDRAKETIKFDFYSMTANLDALENGMNTG